MNAARGDRTQARLRPARETGRIAPTDKYIVHQASDPSLRDTPHDRHQGGPGRRQRHTRQNAELRPAVQSETAEHGTKDRTRRSA